MALNKYEGRFIPDRSKQFGASGLSLSKGTVKGVFARLCRWAYRPYSSVMDAPNPSAIPTAASLAPLRIGTVGIRVRDLDRVTAYYRDMLDLTVQEHTRQVAILGVGGIALLELLHKPDALPDDPREAGLYHTAFLMPTRADLARWIFACREEPCALYRCV
jgi:hypothetical protein